LRLDADTTEENRTEKAPRKRLVALEEEEDEEEDEEEEEEEKKGGDEPMTSPPAPPHTPRTPPGELKDYQPGCSSSLQPQERTMGIICPPSIISPHFKNVLFSSASSS